jgi:hypothetical protein
VWQDTQSQGLEMICPKCGYERQAADTAPDYECPRCGIVYAKFKSLQEPAQPQQSAARALTQNKLVSGKAPRGNALKGMFAKIESRGQAIKVARESGVLFMVIAALQGILGVFVQRWLILDAAIFAVCGYLIFSQYNRVAAVVAFALSCVAVITTFMNLTGKNVGGGTNIFLALIVASAGFRAVDATFKLTGELKETAADAQKSEPAAAASVSAKQDA